MQETSWQFPVQQLEQALYRVVKESPMTFYLTYPQKGEQYEFSECKNKILDLDLKGCVYLNHLSQSQRVALFLKRLVV